MRGLFYNDILERIKVLNNKSNSIPPKLERLKDILEHFEKEHDIIISGVFNKDGLEIISGFQREYIDEEKLGAYGCKLCDIGVEFMAKVLEDPLTSEKIDEILKTNIQERKVDLKCMILEVTFERMNPKTLQKEQFFTPIIIIPIDNLGLIIMIIKHRENLALIKMNLDYLKESIRNIIL